MTTAGRPTRSAIYAQLREAIVALHAQRGLPTPSEAEAIWAELWIRETHHSTAIEGNTLVLKQVAAVIDEGRAVGEKQLREYLEVTGYADAARWVYAQGRGAGPWPSDDLITRTELRRIHEMALSPVWQVAPHPDAFPEESPGSFRRHDIQEFPGGMRPPVWKLVPAEVAEWVGQANQLQRSFDVTTPERIAGLHAAFERIHPFLDGNGRVGRLATNLILVRLGYPPAVVTTRERTRHLDALRLADDGNLGPLGELLARSILDNLYRFVAPASGADDALVPLTSLADDRINASALRNAANRGRLRAARGDDGRWRSTRTWVEAYLAEKYRR